MNLPRIVQAEERLHSGQSSSQQAQSHQNQPQQQPRRLQQRESSSTSKRSQPLAIDDALRAPAAVPGVVNSSTSPRLNKSSDPRSQPITEPTPAHTSEVMHPTTQSRNSRIYSYSKNPQVSTSAAIAAYTNASTADNRQSISQQQSQSQQQQQQIQYQTSNNQNNSSSSNSNNNYIPRSSSQAPTTSVASPTQVPGNTYFSHPDLQDFSILKKLGEGSFSTVYCVRRGKDNKEYAMKRIKIMKLNEKERENAINEVRFLASISNRNIISYKQALYDESVSQLCVIMEYAEGGDLSRVIRRAQKQQQYLDESLIWSFAIQMTNGLKALHDLQILHRDLKSANIFLDKHSTRVMLGDLNVSKKLKSDGLLYTQTGTPYYASPEVWKDKPYNSKSDIWSLGCVIYEMCALKPPFKGKDMEDLYRKVQRGTYDPIPSVYSFELSQFLSMLLRVNADTRPSCSEILKSQLVLKQMNTFDSDLILAESLEKSELINTIRVGKSLQGLKDRLPISRYETTGSAAHTISSLHQPEHAMTSHSLTKANPHTVNGKSKTPQETLHTNSASANSIDARRKKFASQVVSGIVNNSIQMTDISTSENQQQQPNRNHSGKIPAANTELTTQSQSSHNPRGLSSSGVTKPSSYKTPVVISQIQQQQQQHSQQRYSGATRSTNSNSVDCISSRVSPPNGLLNIANLNRNDIELPLHANASDINSQQKRTPISVKNLKQQESSQLNLRVRPRQGSSLHNPNSNSISQQQNHNSASSHHYSQQSQLQLQSQQINHGSNNQSLDESSIRQHQIRILQSILETKNKRRDLKSEASGISNSIMSNNSNNLNQQLSASPSDFQSISKLDRSSSLRKNPLQSNYKSSQQIIESHHLSTATTAQSSKHNNSSSQLEQLLSNDRLKHSIASSNTPILPRIVPATRQTIVSVDSYAQLRGESLIAKQQQQHQHSQSQQQKAQYSSPKDSSTVLMVQPNWDSKSPAAAAAAGGIPQNHSIKKQSHSPQIQQSNVSNNTSHQNANSNPTKQNLTQPSRR